MRTAKTAGRNGSAVAADVMPAPETKAPAAVATKRITQNRLEVFLDAEALVKAEKDALKAELMAGAEVEDGTCEAVVNHETPRDTDWRGQAVELADRLIKAGLLKGMADGEAWAKAYVGECPRKEYDRLKVWRDE